jgi:hypothetical protein
MRYVAFSFGSEDSVLDDDSIINLIRDPIASEEIRALLLLIQILVEESVARREGI